MRKSGTPSANSPLSDEILLENALQVVGLMLPIQSDRLNGAPVDTEGTPLEKRKRGERSVR